MRTGLAVWVLAGLTGGVNARQPSSGLSGTAWQLVQFQGGDDTVRKPDNRSNYTLDFGAD